MHFPSFRDETEYCGRRIPFLKRAQICVNDFSYVLRSTHALNRLELLTAFADYKLPQFLRFLGVLRYAPTLERKIHRKELIPAGSSEEVEIRAATLVAIDLIRQKLDGKYTAAQIDNAIWLLSQHLPREASPYHRTRTTCY